MAQSRTRNLGKLHEHDAEFHAFVDHLITHFHPCKVIWFGPRAMGETADEDAEYYVMVVTDAGVDWKELTLAIGRSFRHRFPLELFVRSAEEFESGRAHSGSFAHEAQRTGQVLYER